MTDMNFSMDGLNELIESLEKKNSQEDQHEEVIVSNDEKMQAFSNIINGVARKYFSYGKEGAKYLSEEDAIQELWVRILSLIQDCGGIENTDESLVARVAYNKAVDLYRFYKRRHESKAEYIEGSEQENDEDTTKGRDEGSESALYQSRFMKGYELVLYKQVINLFPIGSKERKYIILKIVNEGLLKASDLDPWDRALVAIPETEDEAGYIHLLGYTSHCPGSWTCKKRDMKEIIVAFLRS